MPRDRTQQSSIVEGLTSAPTVPHLGVLAEYEQGSGAPVFQALPTEVAATSTPGAILAVITDPSNPRTGIMPFVITKVTPKRIEARCACGDRACSRRYAWNLVVRGLHPYGKPAIGVKR